MAPGRRRGGLVWRTRPERQTTHPTNNGRVELNHGSLPMLSGTIGKNVHIALPFIRLKRRNGHT